MSDYTVPRSRILAYALPSLALSAVAGPILAILPSLYAKHAQLSLAAVGSLFLLARVFDAVTDPLIGYWSDRTITPLGARKPWIIAGGVLIALSVYFLFAIPPTAGIVYFGGWALVYYLGATMFNIPHMAWGSEISTDYTVRTRVFTYRSLFDGLGGFIYSTAPLLLFALGLTARTDFSPQVFETLKVVVLLILPVVIGVAVVHAPTGELRVTEKSNLRGLYGAVIGNRPMLRFLSAYVIAGLATGFFAALFFPFLDTHLQLGDKVPLLLLAVMTSSLVSVPVWQKIVLRLGKHRAWAWGWMGGAVLLFPLVLVEPGPYAFPITLVVLILHGFTSGASTLAPLALLGDIVDYEVMRSRVDRAGNYYAFMLLVAKMAGAGGGLAFIILGAVFGYELSAGVENSAFAKLGMSVMFCVVPGVIQLTAIPLIWNFPIDRRRHEIIRRRLARRHLLAEVD